MLMIQDEFYGAFRFSANTTQHAASGGFPCCHWRGPCRLSVGKHRATPCDQVSLILFILGCLAAVLPGAGADVAPHELVLMIVKQGTEDPLSNARATLRTGEVAKPKATGESDNSGKIVLRWESEKSEPVKVQVIRSGFAPLEMTWLNEDAGSGTPASFTFALPPSRTVGGQVQDEAGRPVVGAQVTINFPQALSGPRVPIESFPISTDADGRWHTDIVPADTAFLPVAVEHPDYLPPEGQAVEEPTLNSLQDRTALFKLRSTCVLDGQVLDLEGRPVAGAKVVRGQEWGIMGVEEANKTETDAAGKFHFGRLTAGKAMVAAQAPGFGPAKAVTEIRQGATPLVLKLQKSQTLRGQVTDPAGAPLAAVDIKVDGWGDFRYPGIETKTGADGRFTLSDLPDDQVQLDFEKGGYMRTLFYRLQPGPEEQVVKLTPILRVHGKVVDAATGQPIPEFTLTPGSARHGMGAGGKVENIGVFWADREVKSFSDGEFDLTFSEPLVHGSTPMPDFQVRIQAKGYDPAASRFIKPDEEDATINLQLHKGTGWRIIVKFADGRPAADAKVYATTESEFLFVRNGKVDYHGDSLGFTTDEGGVFTMPKPLEPRRLLVLHDSGYAEWPAAKLTNAIEISLEPWARLEGTLKVGRRLGTNETVAVNFPRRMEEMAGGGIRHNAFAFTDYQTSTDAEGRFVFDRLPAGEAGVCRVLKIERPMGMGFSASEVWGGCILGTVRLRPGQTAQVMVGGDGGAVIGQLTVPPEIKDPIEWNRGFNQISPKLAKLAVPDGLASEALQAWVSNWFWSDAGQLYRRWFGRTPQVLPSGQMMVPYPHWPLKIEADGRFRIDDLPTSNYVLTIRAYHPAEKETERFGPGKLAGKLVHNFTVPPQSGSADDQPLDLGRLILQVAQPEDNRSLAMIPSNRGTAGPSTDPVAAIQLEEPTGPQRVVAAAALHPSRVKSGESTTLLLKVRIAPGCWMAPLAKPSGAATSTRLEITLPAGWQNDGECQAPEPMPNGLDNTPVYYREVVFRQPVKVLATAVPGSVEIHATFHCQASNSLFSWPPAVLTLKASAEVVLAK